MTTVTIPIGNDHQPVEFMPSVGRTSFQDMVVRMIMKLNGFDFFCGNPMCDEFYRGPVCICWYDSQGGLNIWRVGVDRVLQKVRSVR